MNSRKQIKTKQKADNEGRVPWGRRGFVARAEGAILLVSEARCLLVRSQACGLDPGSPALAGGGSALGGAGPRVHCLPATDPGAQNSKLGPCSSVRKAEFSSHAETRLEECGAHCCVRRRQGFDCPHSVVDRGLRPETSQKLG